MAVRGVSLDHEVRGVTPDHEVRGVTPDHEVRGVTPTDVDNLMRSQKYMMIVARNVLLKDKFAPMLKES